MTTSIYAAPSLTAEAVSYSAIQVLWTNPPSGSSLRLVRNSYGVPADESDGAVLIQQGLTGVPSYLDSASLNTAAVGTFFYYSLFTQDSGGVWWRAGDVQAILPKDWGYGSWLKSLLPAYLFDLGSEMLT